MEHKILVSGFKWVLNFASNSGLIKIIMVNATKKHQFLLKLIIFVLKKLVFEYVRGDIMEKVRTWFSNSPQLAAL